MNELEDRLADLGSRLEWPETDLTGAVRTRLVVRPTRRIQPAWATAAVLILAVVLAVGTPGGRSAVADVLGVVGIRITWLEGPLPSIHADLAVGEAVTLAEAVSQVDHPLLVPTALGPPDAVYVDDGRVSTVWLPTAELPEVGGFGIGLLHMQFAAAIDTGLLSKQLQDGTNIEAVEVRGRAGYWIEGEPHVLNYVDPDGVVRAETTRLAENVLLWTEDGVTHRIESALSLETVVSIAESLQMVG